MAFMVPLVKNHYDIYSRNTTPDDSIFASQASLNQSKRSLFSNGSKTNGSSNSVRTNSSGTTVGRNTRNSSSNGGNKKILIKITSRPANGSSSKSSKTGQMVVATTTGSGRNGSSVGRLSSASISLPIRTENGKTVIALKPSSKFNIINKSSNTKKSNPATNGNSSNGSSEASLVNSSNTSIGATRPVPHVRRTVRNPYTNRVYSYSVSIPDYVAEEDEEDAIDDNESDLSKEDDDDLMLYSSSAPPSHHLNRPVRSASQEDEDTFSIASSLLSAPPSLPPSPNKLSGHSTNSTRCSTITINQSTINNFNHHKHSKTLAALDSGLPPADSSAGSTSEQPTCTPNNAREGIELLRKFILQLKMLKLGGSARKLFNGSSSSSNNNENTKPKSGRRSRKNTLDDSKHL